MSDISGPKSRIRKFDLLENRAELLAEAVHSRGSALLEIVIEPIAYRSRGSHHKPIPTSIYTRFGDIIVRQK